MDATHIQFINDKLGWLDDRQGKLYKSVDGGKTWQLSDKQNNGQLQDIFFINENLGWIVPIRNLGILKTTDGGKNWLQQTLPTNDFSLTSMQFLNEKEGWMTGYGEFDSPKQPSKSILLHTLDGGQNWEIVTTVPGDTSFRKIFFSDPSRGWLHTSTTLYRTTDQGKTWIPILTYPKRPEIYEHKWNRGNG